MKPLTKYGSPCELSTSTKLTYFAPQHVVVSTYKEAIVMHADATTVVWMTAKDAVVLARNLIRVANQRRALDKEYRKQHPRSASAKRAARRKKAR